MRMLGQVGKRGWVGERMSVEEGGLGVVADAGGAVGGEGGGAEGVEDAAVGEGGVGGVEFEADGEEVEEGGGDEGGAGTEEGVEDGGGDGVGESAGAGGLPAAVLHISRQALRLLHRLLAAVVVDLFLFSRADITFC